MTHRSKFLMVYESNGSRGSSISIVSLWTTARQWRLHTHARTPHTFIHTHTHTTTHAHHTHTYAHHTHTHTHTHSKTGKYIRRNNTEFMLSKWKIYCDCDLLGCDVAVLYLVTTVLEEHSASIFRVSKHIQDHSIKTQSTTNDIFTSM
jgi:ABC-type nickel/cobalt efflux system permease component RcnA